MGEGGAGERASSVPVSSGDEGARAADGPAPRSPTAPLAGRAAWECLAPACGSSAFSPWRWPPGSGPAVAHARSLISFTLIFSRVGPPGQWLRWTRRERLVTCSETLSEPRCPVLARPPAALSSPPPPAPSHPAGGPVLRELDLPRVRDESPLPSHPSPADHNPSSPSGSQATPRTPFQQVVGFPEAEQQVGAQDQGVQRDGRWEGGGQDLVPL